VNGGRLKTGQKEKVFGITFFKPGEDVTEALLTDVKWEVS